MTDQIPLLWELVLDGVQILLCIIIFLFLLHNRLKYKGWFFNSALRENTVAFSEQTRMQHLKQLTEKSFDNVVNAINQERLALQTQFENGATDSEQHASVLQTHDNLKSLIQDDEKKGQGHTDLVKFSEIVALSDKGLTIPEISQRLNMPGGEVELVLRLNKYEVADKNDNTLRVRA